MKPLGIVAHSAEGGALCFLAACREGQRELGPHMHPEIVLSAIPIGLSMNAWEADDHETVAHWLRRGIDQVADAGAEFFVCPDNTAHIVLEQMAGSFPIPGLHIADVVASELARSGWARAALLGTEWTMTGTVYPRALARSGAECLTPPPEVRAELDRAIFAELCQGVFRPETVSTFVNAIADLREEGADCVILGCTEIPLIITPDNSSLPVLDSTRLLAAYAVREACIETDPVMDVTRSGWLSPRASGGSGAATRLASLSP